jgi:sigma-B regulation protein RsbU (phosphoserine phosphatase)
MDHGRLLTDLRTIIESARAIGAERDLDRLLDRIIVAACALARADRASLFVVDRAKGELWTRRAQGSGEIRLPLGKGIAGAVATSGETINISEAYADERFDRGSDQRSGYRTRSILALPLRNHTDAIVAVLQVLNRNDGQAFDAHDADVLSALGSQAAVAIDNAVLAQAEAERQRMARDLEVARDIQAMLLPQHPPELAGWRLAAFCRSCDETGGDYWDALPRPDGGCDILVGDITGHGIGAALMMSTARAFVRALHPLEADPARLLARLNDLLEPDFNDEVFMTFALARLGRDGSVLAVNAGHEPTLVWRRASGFESIPAEGIVLGMLPGLEYTAASAAPLAPGDLVVLLTDGIFEAQAPPDFAQFGMKAVQAAISSAAPQGAAAVRDAIIAAVEAHLGDHRQHDDMTLVVAERRA